MYKKAERGQNVDLSLLGERTQLRSYDRSKHTQGRQKIRPRGENSANTPEGQETYTGRWRRQKLHKITTKTRKTMTQDLTSGNALAGRLNVKTCNER